MHDAPSETPRSVVRRLRCALGRGFLRLTGWKIEGGAPGVSKAVVVAYPHTSNWDLPYCLAAAYALDLDIRWLGKQSLFGPPFGGVLRWLGGIPVVRSHRTQLVDAIAKSLEPLERALVVIPPEGTRARAGRWKSGFYWVAVRARIPIVLSFLDYGRRTTGLGMVLEPSGDIETDFEAIQHFYAGVQGKYPDNQGELTLVDENSES